MRSQAVIKQQSANFFSVFKSRAALVWLLVAVCCVSFLVSIRAPRALAAVNKERGGRLITRDEHANSNTAQDIHDSRGISAKPARRFSPDRHDAYSTAYSSTDCSCDSFRPTSLPPSQSAAAPDQATPDALEQGTGPERIQLPSSITASSADLLFDTYVVSVGSRQDRRQYICAVLQRLGIPALIWPAFSADSPEVQTIRQELVQERHRLAETFASQGTADGNVSDAELEAVRQHVRHKDEVLSAGEVACYASHRAIWRDAVARGGDTPVLVLEDDADLEAGFTAALRGALARLPADWDVLWVGSCYEENRHAEQPQRVAHRLYRAIEPMCTHAYLLRSSAAAATLLSHAGNISNPWAAVDHGILRTVREAGMHGYAMLPPPVTQLPRDVPPPAEPQRTSPPDPPPTAHQSFKDRMAMRAQQRRDRDRADSHAFPRPGAPRGNPSAVKERPMWLPLQRLVHPVRELMLAEEEVLAGLAGGAAGGGGPDAAWNRTCGNPLFELSHPLGTPPPAMSFSDAEYRP